MSRTFLSISTALMAAALMVLPRAAAAWGREGHEIVAEVAMHYLSEGARTQVQQILKKMTPGDAGNWMDDMRSNDYYRFMQHWHYVDIPKDSNYRAGSGDNLIAALNTVYNDLKRGKPNKEQQREDVLILFHLIGDMHQPLHTGYPDDKGGNSIQVNYGGSGTNLHHIWDTEIITDQGITLDSVLLFGNTITVAQLHSLRGGNFVSWMYDSRSHLDQVYDFKGHKLSAAYIAQNKALVERQLFLGGIRLARTLESLFPPVVQSQ